MPHKPFARRAAVPTLGAVLAGVLTAAVVAGTTGAAAHAATPSPMVARQAAAVAAPATRPTITKVVTFMVENHSLDQMRRSMPFVHQLATSYAYATDYTAITHPSLPNYLAIASGGTHGVTDDNDPAAHPLRGVTVFDQALARHKTATVYADSMTSNCQLRNAGRYAVRHNPWTYFTGSRARCRVHDLPGTRLAKDAAAGTLPNAGLVIPNLVHDAHDAALSTSDAWLKTQIRALQAGPDWKSGHLAIVVTADEDDRHSGNKVLTVVASRYQAHRVVATHLTHYSLTRLYDDVLGAPYLGAAAKAPSLSAAFAMPTPKRP